MLDMAALVDCVGGAVPVELGPVGVREVVMDSVDVVALPLADGVNEAVVGTTVLVGASVVVLAEVVIVEDGTTEVEVAVGVNEGPVESFTVVMEALVEEVLPPLPLMLKALESWNLVLSESRVILHPYLAKPRSSGVQVNFPAWLSIPALMIGPKSRVVLEAPTEIN